MRAIKRKNGIWVVYALFVVLLSLLAILFVIHPLAKKTTTIQYQVKNTIEDVSAEAFLAKDTNSSTILYAKNIHLKLPPASLTKVMTAVIAIESGKLDDIVTIQKDAIEVEPSKLNLKVGDKFLLRDLLKAALVMSSNDAAMAIGIYLGGSEERFVAMMNKKADELGMHDTHFTNPCGFDVGENISTAYDLMLLAQHAIKSPLFNEMVNIQEETIYNIDGTKGYHLRTHNKLFRYYQYTVGIKTGYTQKAGPCLIARAKHEAKDALLIILHSGRGDRWGESKHYFDDIFGIKEQEQR